MPRHISEQEHLEMIRDWFGRHRRDYCHHDQAPPRIWCEYVAWLIARVDALERRVRVDDQGDDR